MSQAEFNKAQEAKAPAVDLSKVLDPQAKKPKKKEEDIFGRFADADDDFPNYK